MPVYSGGSCRGSSGGRSSGGSRRSRSGDAAGRCNSKNKDDQESQQASHWWSNLSIDNNPFTRYVANRSEAEWKFTCRVLKELHDECITKSGINHQMCRSYRMSWWVQECKDCPKSGKQPSGVWYSLNKDLVRGSEEAYFKKTCHLHKLRYDECRRDIGDNHRVCQFRRRQMINEDCADYVKKSDQEALDYVKKSDQEALGMSFRSSIANFFENIYKKVFG